MDPAYVSAAIIAGVISYVGSLAILYYGAQNRYRSGGMWIVWGILLSPVLAIIMLLVLGTPRDPKNRV